MRDYDLSGPDDGPGIEPLMDHDANTQNLGQRPESMRRHDRNGPNSVPGSVPMLDNDLN